MDYELSEADIKALVPGVRIISYPDLEKYARIEDVLDGEGRVVILFLTTGLSEGHWTCLHANPATGVLEFFDSYGIRPDGERRWLSASKLVELHEKTPLLKPLLDRAKHEGWKVVFNPFHFQNEKDNSETCGRHVAVRLLHGGLNISQYKTYLTNSHLTPDQFVVEETRSVLHK